MLRLLVGALLVANLAFWAWTQPAVTQALGWPSSGERQPERLAQQVRPQAVRVLPPRPAAAGSGSGSGSGSGAIASAAGSAGSAAAASAAEGPLACLETPPLVASQVPLAVRALQAAGVGAGGWVEMRRDQPGRWMVYMGRFADRDQLARKGVELAAMKLPFDELLVGEWALGLRLGEFGSANEAQGRLNQLQGRGVRTARILSLVAPSQEVRVRADRLSAGATAQLQQQSAAPASGASAPVGSVVWTPCGP